MKAKAALFCGVFSLQAERIMEALELHKEENRKMEEHKYACQTAGKEVETGSSLLTLCKQWESFFFKNIITFPISFFKNFILCCYFS